MIAFCSWRSLIRFSRNAPRTTLRASSSIASSGSPRVSHGLIQGVDLFPNRPPMVPKFFGRNAPARNASVSLRSFRLSASTWVVGSTGKG